MNLLGGRNGRRDGLERLSITQARGKKNCARQPVIGTATTLLWQRHRFTSAAESNANGEDERRSNEALNIMGIPTNKYINASGAKGATLQDL